MSNMKVIGAILILAVARLDARGGPARISNHPVCVAIMNTFYHSFADPEDCSCFYKCDWADAVQFCCPADNETPNEDGYLVFNPILQVCDRKPAAVAAGAICPSVAPTPGPTAPTPGPTVPTPGPTAPTGPPSCTHPPGPSTLPPGPSTPPPGPSDGCSYNAASCPPDNSFYHSYKHETCDNKWCQCDWGQGVVQPCPLAQPADGSYLVFDPVSQVCDYQKPGVTYTIC